MRELGHLPHTPGRFRSQRGSNEPVWVKRHIVWPQNYIVGAENKGKNAYQGLDVFQFVTGFASQIRDESDVDFKNNMLQYLAELFEDASWLSAKYSHQQVCCKMEEGRLEWDDMPGLDRCRRSYAQRATPSHKESTQEPDRQKSNFKNEKSDKRIFACSYYQNNSYSRSKEHGNANNWYKHICLTCFKKGEHIRHRDCHGSYSD